MIVPQIVGPGGMGQAAFAPSNRIAQATELLCRQLATGANLLDALQRVTGSFNPILTAQEQQAIVAPAKACAAARTAPDVSEAFRFLIAQQTPTAFAPSAPTTTTPTAPPATTAIVAAICAGRALGKSDAQIQQDLLAQGHSPVFFVPAMAAAAAQCPPGAIAPTPDFAPTVPGGIPSALVAEQKQKDRDRNIKIAIGVGLGVVGLTIVGFLLR